jgi:restriction system protein
VSYLVLHELARPAVAVSGQPVQVPQLITQAMWKGMASAGQYLVPLACFFAAILSAVGRHQRKKLISDVAQGNASDALDGMKWQQFEMLVGEAFRLQGYRVMDTGGAGPDGGIDLVLHKDREKFFVQCKQWKAFKVGVQVVRELYGVMAAKGAAGGFVVTSGRFTEEASAFASGRNVTLIDGSKLFGLIQQAKSSLAGPASAVEGQFPSRTPPSPPARPSVTSSSATVADAGPTCPICSSHMVIRTAKRGANAGGRFWGCATYPVCKGTRQVEPGA